MSTYTGVSVKVENLRPTIAALEKLGVDVQDLKEAFSAIGQRVELRAKAYTNDRTGNLDRGIKASRRKNAAVISSRAPISVNSQGKSQGRRGYHRFREFGGGHGAPVAYLRRAVADVRPQVTQLVAWNVNAAIRRSGLG